MREKKQLNYTSITFLMLFVAALFITSIFYSLYTAERGSILRTWHTNTVQAARDVDYYMTMPKDAVSFAAETINGMVERGATYEDVGKYLVDQTVIYASMIDENTTGIYAYFDGHYLDGSGWTPPRDYEPTERPWYKAGIEGGGEITFVKPYVNIQTKTMMMSVCCMLSDGKGVVSMDVFLDGVQEMAERMARKADMDSSLVIDKDGFVVAHSDAKDIGKNYREEGDAFQQELVEKLQSRTSGEYEMSENGKDYIVISEPVGDDWSIVFLLDKKNTFASLGEIYFSLGAALVGVVSAILAVFLHISQKQRESMRLGREILAMADIYFIAVRAEMATGNMEVIRGDENLERLLQNDFSNFNGRAKEFADRMSSERSKGLVHNFMDPRTLKERLFDVDSITQEFMDVRGRWVRLRFIVVDRDEEKMVSELLWTLESIDEDRKQQEKLRRLSETDLMTGVKNRGSGEAMIRQKIAEGNQGMFLLLDADDFKSVNDTFGHTVGDKVIISIADALKKAFRDTDVVFRLGGDEFAVFAEGVLDRGVGTRVIYRFFDELAAEPLPELKGRGITVSVGAAFYTDTQTDTFEALYERADLGTYESKRHGGNHVTFNEKM